MPRKTQIEVILPVYNEVKNILPLLKDLAQIADALADHATFSYLFINDGSVDGTKELLGRLYRERTDIRVVSLIHNFGHNSALGAGIDYFSGDVAVFMDADLQDSPSAIIDMFRLWQKGAKTVVAERGERQEKTKVFFKVFYKLLHKMAPTLPPIEFGTFCLLDKQVVRRLAEIKERSRYFPGLVSFASTKIYSVKIDRDQRLHGSSRVGFPGLVNLALTAMLSFSNTPVRMVSLLGLACAGCAIGLGTIILMIKLFTNNAIPGWASTMVALSFGTGIQLLCLGIIGEYIARIFDEVKRRPLYLVDKLLDKSTAKKEDAA